MSGKKCLLTLLFLSACSACLKLQARDVRIAFTNTGNIQRSEVVEMNLDSLRKMMQLGPSDPFVIRNPFGQEVAWQSTYDGKLLLYVSVRPHTTSGFTARPGTPSPMPSAVSGKMYPIREDDFAWENDKGAYRAYGPALAKTGEKSYGIDIWVKNTPDMILDERYYKDAAGNVEENALRKEGLKQKADSVDRVSSFHIDHGNGMDVYEVGPTLGCGTPALMSDSGKIIYPYCYQTYQILDKGPLRFTFQLNFPPNADGVVEHRIISLDKGSHFNRITVWYDHLNTPAPFVSGVVLHTPKGKLQKGVDFALDKEQVSYADPTQQPRACGSSIYVAVLFPQGVDRTYVTDDGTHALGLIKHYTGGRYSYLFGSAWSDYDIKTFPQWQVVIKEKLQNLQHPLKADITALR
ncbi:DUF4861 domain-containing protein [Prevotella cerevisiae]|uniref:DUF4861 domain-containing protein n=1 Tax=Segatella cerevisiae TaxID=2053716 RepID=A0ABT1BZF4_9BACT|nr:DUF4861 family protein [Segatella cerevisiae]MCO6026215.1 DUF4861 domain-containing protein [Segatella cerevisiae]